MTKGLSSFILAGLLALGAGIFSLPVPGAEPEGAEIVEILGTAQVGQGTPLQAGDRVSVGQTLSTPSGSLVKLRLSPTQGLTMLQNTTLLLLKETAQLQSGSLVVQGVPALQTQAGIIGTERSRGLIDFSENRLLVVSIAGAVTIRNEGWSLTLNTGEGTIFTVGQTLSAPRSISPDKLALRFPQLSQAEPPASLAPEPSPTAPSSDAPTPEPTEEPILKPAHEQIYLSLGLISAFPLDDAPALVPGGMLGLSYYFQPAWGVHGSLASYFSSGFNTIYIPVTLRYRHVLDPQLALYGGAGLFAAIAGQAGVVPGLLGEFGVDLNFPYVGLYAGTDVGLSFGNPIGLTLGLRVGFRHPL